MDSSAEVAYNSNLDIFEIKYKGQNLLLGKNGNIIIANEQTVIFNANGGYVATQFKNVTVGDEYGELPTPTREGYTFLGCTGENLFNPQEYYEVGKNYGISIKENDIIQRQFAYQERYTKTPIQCKENTQYTLSYDWEIIGIYNSSPEILSGLTLRNYANENLTLPNFDTRGSIVGQTDHISKTNSVNTTVKYIVSGGWHYWGAFKFSNIRIVEETTEYITNNTKVTQNQKYILTAQWQEN